MQTLRVTTIAFAVTFGTLFGTVEGGRADEPVVQTSSGIAVTAADIASFKDALQLTSAQEPYWIPVAAALRRAAMDRPEKSVVLDAVTISRLLPVLRPLLTRLGDDQRRVVLGLAQRIGLGRYASLM